MERRLPENAELRAQLDAQHKDFVTARAELAEQRTTQNAIRIEQVGAAVRSLSARLGAT